MTCPVAMKQNSQEAQCLHHIINSLLHCPVPRSALLPLKESNIPHKRNSISEYMGLISCKKMYQSSNGWGSGEGRKTIQFL